MPEKDTRPARRGTIEVATDDDDRPQGQGAGAQLPSLDAEIRSESLSPSEMIQRDRAPAPMTRCPHDDPKRRIRMIMVTGGGHMYVTYCSQCGSLGPAQGHKPSLSQWMAPG